MTCHECLEQLAAYAERLLNNAEARDVERHFTACDECRAEYEETNALRERLLASCDNFNAANLAGRVMDQILVQQVEMARRRKMRSRFRTFAVSGVAAAVVVSVTWAAITHGPARATAAEVIARGAQAAANLKSIYLKVRMRTIPGDNFQMLALDHDFVEVELWKQYDPLKWKIAKPGRVAVMDGKQTVMIINDKRGVKVDKPTPSAFDTEWLHRLAAIDRMLAAELVSSKEAAKFDDADRSKTNADNVIIEASAGDVGDYLKNKALETSDTRREYSFDHKTGRLSAAKFYCHDKGRDILVLDIVEIKYDLSFDDATFELRTVDDIEWYKDPERLPDNERYEQMTPAEAARTFFEACSDKDWEEAQKFLTTRLTDDFKQHLGGLQIINLGEPFQAWPYGGWFVPYEIRLGDGAVRKHNLALRKDNPARRFMVDGGL